MIKQKSESLKTPTAGRLFAVMSVFVCMLITNIPAVGDSDKTGEFISADDAGWRAQAMNAITEMEYQITLRDRKDCRGDQSEYHAVNRRQDLRIFFKGDGLRIVRRTESSPSWNWSWRLNALGRRGDLHNTAQPIRAAHRNIMEYRRPGLLETYENTEAGFIQRLELNVPPAGSGPVEIKVMCGTGLEVTQIGRGVPVDFRHEGRTILQYSEMTATDTAEKTLPAEIIFENDLATIVVNDEGALYPLSVTLVVKGPADGMLPGFPDWTYADDREDAQLGFSVATAGDVNGDGFSDVIVGAYQYDEDFGNQGKVFVFHGSETGLPTLPSWMFSGPSSEHFGWSVATAGDVNGDGFSDIVVGSPRYTFNSEIRGKAYVFHGSRDGLA
ncbi:MAG TPA: integrin alpha, partial [Candidatus Sumerlaeota bacterium]|nr:integrin alpha [Candidatus Sumerlaeota bacterium]